jgi:glycosyltransferase involved in cell wall biosynthesis
VRILFLTSEVPYPPDSGGRIKTHSLIEFLRREHDLSVLCFRRQPLTPEQKVWATEVGDVRTIPLNRGRHPLMLARSYLAAVPLSIQRNRTIAMAGLVAEELRLSSFEAVFVDGWLMGQYLPSDFAGLKLLHEHNAEYVMWRREADAARNPVSRFLLRREYERVREYEAQMLSHFDACFAVSEPDRQALIALGAPPEQVRVLPNLPDPSLLDAPALSFEASTQAMLFLGTLSWKPNIDSAGRLLSNIFPAVRDRLPGTSFILAGRGAPRSLQSLAERTPGVELVADVTDAESLYRRARVFVEATTTGGGTKLKVLNAVARGLPVVASVQGAAGLEVTSGHNIMLASDDTSFVEAVVRIMTDAEVWHSQSESGRALVREKYVATIAFGPLVEALRGVAATG